MYVYLYTILLTENPLNCDCDQQELWEWMKDHQKLMSKSQQRGLTCQHPPHLQGQVFVNLEPRMFCAIPVVRRLAIQDFQPDSVFLSWKSRNHSGLHGYKVEYYPIEDHRSPAPVISSMAVSHIVS